MARLFSKSMMFSHGRLLRVACLVIEHLRGEVLNQFIYSYTARDATVCLNLKYSLKRLQLLVSKEDYCSYICQLKFICGSLIALSGISLLTLKLIILHASGVNMSYCITTFS